MIVMIVESEGPWMVMVMMIMHNDEYNETHDTDAAGMMWWNGSWCRVYILFEMLLIPIFKMAYLLTG